MVVVVVGVERRRWRGVEPVVRLAHVRLEGLSKGKFFYEFAPRVAGDDDDHATSVGRVEAKEKMEEEEEEEEGRGAGALDPSFPSRPRRDKRGMDGTHDPPHALSPLLPHSLDAPTPRYHEDGDASSGAVGWWTFRSAAHTQPEPQRVACVGSRPSKPFCPSRGPPLFGASPPPLSSLPADALDPKGRRWAVDPLASPRRPPPPPPAGERRHREATVTSPLRQWPPQAAGLAAVRQAPNGADVYRGWSEEGVVVVVILLGRHSLPPPTTKKEE